MFPLGNTDLTLDANDVLLIRNLPEPTGSFALKACDGSSARIKELHKHIINLPSPLPPFAYSAIAPITFLGLNPVNIPPKPEPDMQPMQDAATRAFLCLEILAQCVRMVNFGQTPAMTIAAHILRKHDNVFPWVHFVQRCYFGQEPKSSDDRVVVAHRNSAIFILTFVSTSLAQVREKLNYAKHPLLVETVIDVWRKIIHLDLEANAPFLGSLCIQTDTILTHLFNRGKPSQPIINLCGGQAAMVALFLAHMERDVERITNPANEVPFLKLRSILHYFLSFLSNPPFLSELLAQRAITRIAAVVKRVHRKCTSRRSSSEVTNPAALSNMALQMFGSFAWFADIPAVEEILSSGTLRTLRKNSWSTPKKPLEPDSLDLVTSCVMAYAVYPAIIRRAMKLTQLPSPSSPEPESRRIWRDYDAFVAAYGRLWAGAAAMARVVNGVCATCQAGPDRKVLHTCSGCLMRSYCSVTCQKFGWKLGDHRLECKVFGHGQTQSKIIKGCRGLIYIALIENHVLRQNLADKVSACLSSIASKPMSGRDEIPVLLLRLDPEGNTCAAKRWTDFPDIFNETWKSLLLPNLKGCIKFVTVLKLPLGDRNFHLFSPISTMIAARVVEPTFWTTV